MIFQKTITDDKIVIDLIKSCITHKQPTMITYLNQHSFNVYSTNQEYRNLMEDQFVVYAADAGINFAIRWLFRKKYKQFNGTDLNKRIIEILLMNHVKFFILGGDFSEALVKSKFRNQDGFVGYNSGFFPEDDLDKISKKIQAFKLDVVFIGMGVPKQEIIANKLSELVDASLFICVGNFFEFYFGTMKRIPEKYRDKGIEWIYRLFHEPKRLWKRYIIGIPLFIFRVIKYKSSLKNR
jgi:exopolysaccharide biosynthesis WecB/TagA/CpsF family protein